MSLGQVNEVPNKNAETSQIIEAEEKPSTVEQYNGKSHLRSDDKRMVDFLPIVKRIKDPNDALDSDNVNAWTKVPSDWQKLLTGEKQSTDPATNALLHQAASASQATGNTIAGQTPQSPLNAVGAQPTVHVPTIAELEAAKEMFVINGQWPYLPDKSKEQTDKNWLFVPKSGDQKDFVAWPQTNTPGKGLYTSAKSDLEATSAFLKQTQPWAYNGYIDKSGIFRVPSSGCINGNCSSAEKVDVTPWNNVFIPKATPIFRQVDTNINNDSLNSVNHNDFIVQDSFPGMRFKEGKKFRGI